MGPNIEIANEVGFSDLVSFFYRHKLRVISLAVLVSASAALVSFLLTPIYRSQIVVVSNFQELSPGASSSLLSTIGSLGLGGGLLGASDDRKSESLAYLKSRRFLFRFFERFDVLPVLFPRSWDSKGQKWLVEDDEIPTREDAYEKFTRGVLVVSEDKLTGIVTISVDLQDRHKAAEWANSLIEMLNGDVRQRIIDEAERSIQYLKSELETAEAVGLRQSIFSLIEKQIETIMLANVRLDFAFRVVDPAAVSDEDRFESPKRLLLFVTGLMLGAVLGALWGLYSDSKKIASTC